MAAVQMAPGIPSKAFFFLRAFLKDEPEGLVRKTQKIKRWASPKDPGSVQAMENMMELTEHFFLQFKKLRLVWLSYP